MILAQEKIWELVRNSEQTEMNQSFLERYKNSNLGDRLFIRGFWNNKSVILKPYDGYKPIISSESLIAELRTEHELNQGDRFLVIVKKEYLTKLGLLDDYTYIRISGKKTKCPEFCKENYRWTPNLPALEIENIDDIALENIEKYYEKSKILRGLSINTVLDITHQYIGDSTLVESVVMNTLNSQVVGTGRKANMVPVIFPAEFKENDKMVILQKIQAFMLQAIGNPTNKQSDFSVAISEGHDPKTSNLIIVPKGYFFYGNDKVLAEADSPIILPKRFSFNGVALQNFENDDLSYFGWLRKLVLIFKSRKSNLKIEKHDKNYVNNYIESIEELPPITKYYFLGMSQHDRIVSTQLNMDYGRKLQLMNTLAKDTKEHTKLDSSLTYAEDMVKYALDNGLLLGDKNEIYRDGVKIDNLGGGSARAQIKEIARIIEGYGSYTMDQAEFLKQFDDTKYIRIIRQIEEQGLLQRRLNGISLHPALFR